MASCPAGLVDRRGDGTPTGGARRADRRAGEKCALHAGLLGTRCGWRMLALGGALEPPGKPLNRGPQTTRETPQPAPDSLAHVAVACRVVLRRLHYERPCGRWKPMGDALPRGTGKRSRRRDSTTGVRMGEDDEAAFEERYDPHRSRSGEAFVRGAVGSRAWHGTSSPCVAVRTTGARRQRNPVGLSSDRVRGHDSRRTRAAAPRLPRRRRTRPRGSTIRPLANFRLAHPEFHFNDNAFLARAEHGRA